MTNHGDHEACYREMIRIDREWADRYHEGITIKAVISEEGDQNGIWHRPMSIVTILRELDGLTIVVR